MKGELLFLAATALTCSSRPARLHLEGDGSLSVSIPQYKVQSLVRLADSFRNDLIAAQNEARIANDVVNESRPRIDLVGPPHPDPLAELNRNRSRPVQRPDEPYKPEPDRRPLAPFNPESEHIPGRHFPDGPYNPESEEVDHHNPHAPFEPVTRRPEPLDPYSREYVPYDRKNRSNLMDALILGRPHSGYVIEKEAANDENLNKFRDGLARFIQHQREAVARADFAAHYGDFFPTPSPEEQDEPFASYEIFDRGNPRDVFPDFPEEEVDSSAAPEIRDYFQSTAASDIASDIDYDHRYPYPYPYDYSTAAPSDIDYSSAPYDPRYPYDYFASTAPSDIDYSSAPYDDSSSAAPSDVDYSSAPYDPRYPYPYPHEYATSEAPADIDYSSSPYDHGYPYDSYSTAAPSDGDYSSSSYDPGYPYDFFSSAAPSVVDFSSSPVDPGYTYDHPSSSAPSEFDYSSRYPYPDPLDYFASTAPSDVDYSSAPYDHSSSAAPSVIDHSSAPSDSDNQNYFASSLPPSDVNGVIHDSDASVSSDADPAPVEEASAESQEAESQSYTHLTKAELHELIAKGEERLRIFKTKLERLPPRTRGLLGTLGERVAHLEQGLGILRRRLAEPSVESVVEQVAPAESDVAQAVEAGQLAQEDEAAVVPEEDEAQHSVAEEEAEAPSRAEDGRRLAEKVRAARERVRNLIARIDDNKPTKEEVEQGRRFLPLPPHLAVKPAESPEPAEPASQEVDGASGSENSEGEEHPAAEGLKSAISFDEGGPFRRRPGPYRRPPPPFEYPDIG